MGCVACFVWVVCVVVVLNLVNPILNVVDLTTGLFGGGKASFFPQAEQGIILL
tara:strand:- start:1708 stop:1866 length:159 start_codon:yes stop_codon:yes gene_type:complete